MKRIIFLLFLTVARVPLSAQQEMITVSGSIRDDSSGELLNGASVWFQEPAKGTSSNRYGFYALKILPGLYTVEVSFVGYSKRSFHLRFRNDTVIHWNLIPGVDLPEISVRSARESPVIMNSVQTASYHLTPGRVELLPVLLGESDALKTIQLLPGVNSGNEGTSGIQVRGGSHDQNLILLDGVPVYNTNHLFGYLSTFNTDALKEIVFLKGGIPARYGGRLSSVVDMTMKEGNIKKSGGRFTISPVAGHLMAEGPLKKEKASYMISARRSWADLPLMLGLAIAGAEERYGYSMYDVNAKVNWILNPENRLYLSHYQGKDGFFMKDRDPRVREKYSFNWGNFTSMARWNKILSPGLFVNTSVYHSLYRYAEKLEVKKPVRNGQKTFSGLGEISLKSDFDLSLEGQSLKFGYQISGHRFNPEITNFSGFTGDTIKTGRSVSKAVSLSVYGEDEFDLSKRLRINCGLRLFSFHVSGKTAFFPEPRLAAKFLLPQNSALKISVQKMVQSIHLLTNSSLNMPTDLWVMSTGKIHPEEAWLFDVGWSRDFSEGLHLESDIYLKPMKNLVEYKPGVLLQSDSGKTWEDLVHSGNGLNYGWETMIEKSTGKISGWAGYTLAWARRKFEEINFGKYFPFKYDRRHNITITAHYLVSQKGPKSGSLSLSFIFSSGNAITVPDETVKAKKFPRMDEDFSYARYFASYESFPHPNNFRTPPFHHLDLAYSLKKELKNEKERTWKFSVYNVYNRMNPYFYFKNYGVYRQISMLPVIPSVSYSLKF